MLKITELSNSTSKIFKVSNNKVVQVNNRANKIFKNLSKFKKFKNKKFKNPIYIRTIKKLLFLIFDFKKKFNHLK